MFDFSIVIPVYSNAKSVNGVRPHGNTMETFIVALQVGQSNSCFGALFQDCVFGRFIKSPFCLLRHLGER